MVRPHASFCVIRGLSKNGFTGPGPVLASITALTRLVELYTAPPPCSLPADSGRATRHVVAQGPPRELLHRQSSADNLRIDRAHVHVRSHTRPGQGNVQLTQVQCNIWQLTCKILYSRTLLYLHTRRSRNDMRVCRYNDAQLQVTASNVIRNFGPKKMLPKLKKLSPISKGGYIGNIVD